MKDTIWNAVVGRSLSWLIVCLSCISVNGATASQRGVSAASQFDFMTGDWLVAGRRMTPDRRWNPLNAILRVRRIEGTSGFHFEERWVSNALDVEGTADLGTSYRIYDAIQGQWISQYESIIPPLMWPPTGRFQPDEQGIRMEPTPQSDPTGDHSKRVTLRVQDTDKWDFIVERSYDGEQQWFPVQDFAACRLVPTEIPQPQVETVLSGYGGSRSVAVDSVGNVFIGARFPADSTEDVPLIRVRPSGERDVVLRGYHPAGIAISDGWIYVHSSQVSNTGDAVLIRFRPGEEEEFLGRVPGAALAVDAEGNAFTAHWPDSTIYSISPTGTRVEWLTDGTVPTTLGMFYERDEGHLFFASWPSGKIHRTDGKTTSLVATIPGRMGSNVAWLTGGVGLLLATGFGSERIHAVDPKKGRVRVIAGDGIPGFRDGPALAARFSAPNGIGVTASGDTAYVSELLTMRGGGFPENRLRRIVGVREALVSADADTLVARGLCRPPER